MKNKQTDIAELGKYHFMSEISWLNLSENDREWLRRSSTKQQLGKKRVLFEQGSVPSDVYILQKGKVKATQSNPDGSSQIQFLYCSGDMFGYRPILAGELQPVSIVAIEACELLVVSKLRFLELLNKSETLSNQLLVSLSREFSVLVNRINSFTQRDTRQRLALALLLLQDKFKTVHSGNDIEPIQLMRSDLADYVGTSLETLVRILSEFKENGLLRVEGKKIFILDRRKLQHLAALR